MDDTIRAIADPTRRALIDALRTRNDRSLFDLCTHVSALGVAVTRQAVSKHIAVLEEAGLVTVQKVGRTNIHHLDPSRLTAVVSWITTTPPTTPEGTP